jgi:hypothetical protein
LFSSFEVPKLGFAIFSTVGIDRIVVTEVKEIAERKSSNMCSPIRTSQS